MIEFADDDEIERVGANPSEKNETNAGLASVNNEQPAGLRSDFQKFAAGADFATPPGLEKTPPVKRKKGRPRKHPKKIASNQTNPGANGAGAPQGPEIAAIATESVHVKTVPQVELFEQTSIIIKMLGSQTKDPRLHLSKDESVEIAKALDPVINIFLPDLERMDPKTAAILTLGMTVFAVYQNKMLIIQADKNKNPQGGSDTHIEPVKADVVKTEPATAPPINDLNKKEHPPFGMQLSKMI